MMDIDSIVCDSNGLIPCLVQDYESKRVLMLAYMNRESIQLSIEKKLACFWSRSRKCLWTKGETSGNYLHIIEMTTDCDNDTILVKVKKDGPACHKGTDSCFDSGVKIL